jgi:KUP system potassium uptake protein
MIVAVGLFGAALIYGDGAITPAISVLSALEGLNMAMPTFQPYVVPMAVAILLALFAIQSQGTARIGRAFGPVMFVWFLAMALMGISGIVQHPAVLAALNPWYGLTYLFSRGVSGFLVLGGVFLCVTGAEALYADMGHFGRGPIQLSWFAIVFPSLILNYAGQAALVLAGAPTDGNIFYRLCPQPLLMPLIALATVATIIASQAIITGAFSMTRQAILLGWLPRLQIKQTSSKGYGQIYVGFVNFLLMIVTIALTIGFGKSDNLAAAYGIAVSLTMLMTSALLFIAMREIWGWSFIAAGGVAAFFLVIDSGFFLANLTKVAQGGYVPLLLAAAVYGVMLTWHRGAAAVSDRLHESLIPVSDFIAMHEHVFVLRVEILPVPWVALPERITVQEMAPNFWRGEARYGFMEHPQIPDLLRTSKSLGCTVDLDDVTYYVGHETIVRRKDNLGLPGWQEKIFALMERNEIHVSDFLSLPSDQVVEIGRQISI